METPKKTYDRTKISEAILMRIYKHERFLSNLFMQRPILVLGDEDYPHPIHKTACTDGSSIWFHGDFLEKLSPPEVAYVLLHEGIHIALMHRMVNAELRKLVGNNLDAELLNYCLDIFVNYYCDNIVQRAPREFKAPESLVNPKTVHQDYPGVFEEGFERRMSAIQVYLILQKQPQPKGKNKGITVFLLESPDGTPGSAGKGNPIKNDALERTIAGALRMAEMKTKKERDPGTQPGQLEEAVSKILEPVTSLGDFLRTKLLGKKAIHKDYNKSSRATAWMSGPGKPIYPRYAKGPWQRIVVIVDTSGSMEKSDIAHVLDVTSGILDQGRKNHVGTELHIWECDTETRELGIYKKRTDLPSEIKVCGRGGTSFRGPIEKVLLKAKKEKWNWNCTNVIYLTDSYGDANTIKNPKINFLWIVPQQYTEGAKDRLPWGSVLGLSHGKINIIRR